MNELFLVARDLYFQGRYAEFIHYVDEKFGRDLSDNLKDGRQLCELYFWKGMAYLDQGMFEEALQSFEYLSYKYPDSHLADEGKIQLLLAEHRYHDAIQSSFRFQENYPNFWQPYYWRGNAYLAMNECDKAEREFSIVQTSHPEIMQGYEGVFRTKKRKFDLRTKNTLYKEVLSSLRLLAQHKMAGRYQKFEYVQALLMTNQPSEAKKCLDILEKDSEYYFLAQAMIAAWYHDYNTAFEHFSRSLSLTNNHGDKARVLGIAFYTFKRLKKGSEYRELINSIKSDTDATDAVLLWSDAYSIDRSWRQGWKLGVERLEMHMVSSGYDPVIVARYVSRLLSLNMFRQADLILAFAIRLYAYDLEIQRLYCLVAHHKKEWRVAKERFDDFFAKFGRDMFLFYPYINILYQLNQHEKIYEHYNNFMQDRFPSLAQNNHLNQLQIDLLLAKEPNKVQNVNKGRHSLDGIRKMMPIIKEIIHNKSHEVLIICFDRLRGDIDIQESYDGFQTDDILKECIRTERLYNDFDGFANSNREFNYLLVRDFSGSYGLLNFEKTLETLQLKIAKIRPKHLVCMGTSAGAFASILYGQHLGANLVFAMMARLHAFMTPNLTLAHRKVQEHFDLINPSHISLPYLQRQIGGFAPKVYVAICENEASEMLGTYALDGNDPNLHVSYFEGDVHALLEYVGVKNVYAELYRIIKAELKEGFSLSVQRDIFSQLDGYVGSLFDRLNHE